VDAVLRVLQPPPPLVVELVHLSWVKYWSNTGQIRPRRPVLIVERVRLRRRGSAAFDPNLTSICPAGDRARYWREREPDGNRARRALTPVSRRWWWRTRNEVRLARGRNCNWGKAAWTSSKIGFREFDQYLTSI
jgi:hypothetical protein